MLAPIVFLISFNNTLIISETLNERYSFISNDYATSSASSHGTGYTTHVTT
jgi:hypothetical protein